MSIPRFRLLAVIAAVAFFAAACGSSGAPASYDEQLTEYGDEEVSLVEKNYREACESANDDISDVADYCKCSFGKFRDNVPFAVFDRFDQAIEDERDNIATFDDLQALYQNAVNESSEEIGNAEVETDLAELIAFPCTPS